MLRGKLRGTPKSVTNVTLRKIMNPNRSILFIGTKMFAISKLIPEYDSKFEHNFDVT